MKTLTTIILILFTIGLNAQTEKLYIDNTNTTTPLTPCHIAIGMGFGEDTTYAELWDYQSLILPDLSPKAIMDNEMFCAFTLQMLEQYETDCYNDSTVHYYYTLCDMGCWDVPCNKGDTLWHGGLCPEHWHHEEPTFKGFIKWLKLK